MWVARRLHGRLWRERSRPLNADGGIFMHATPEGYASVLSVDPPRVERSRLRRGKIGNRIPVGEWNNMIDYPSLRRTWFAVR